MIILLIFDSDLIKKFKSNYILDSKERITYLYDCLGCEIKLENKETKNIECKNF